MPDVVIPVAPVQVPDLAVGGVRDPHPDVACGVPVFEVFRLLVGVDVAAAVREGYVCVGGEEAWDKGAGAGDGVGWLVVEAAN